MGVQMFLFLSISSNATQYSISVLSLQTKSIFIGNLNSWPDAVSFISSSCMKEYLDCDENVTGLLIRLALFVLFEMLAQ